MIEFQYRNVHNGWCDVTLISGPQSVEIVPSYLTDALRDLLNAVCDAIVHDRGLCLWANEPGTIELMFTRQDAVIYVRARDLENDDLWGHGPSLHQPAEHEGEVLFDAQGDALAFATRVAEEAELVLENLGAARYAEEWRKPFPADALRELRLAIELRR